MRRSDPSDTPGLLYPVPFVEDPKKNPGSIQFVKKEDIKNATVLGPPTLTVTLPQILRTIPQGTIIMKMDIQTHECRVLRTPGAFTSGHLLPYIFMEWDELLKTPASCPDLGGFIDSLQALGYTARWVSL